MADAGCFTGNVDVVVLSFVVKVDTCVFGRLVLSLSLSLSSPSSIHSFIYCHNCRIILSPFGTKSCSIEIVDIFVVIPHTPSKNKKKLILANHSDRHKLDYRSIKTK